MSQTNTARYKYTPDEMSEEEFLNRFVVRYEVFEEIFEELKEADYSVPNQHYIMIGQRGQGKTTLLRKLKLEVEKDKKLSKFLLPIKFSEEQYRVRQLCRFWEEVADYLQTHYEDMFDGILDEIEKHIDDENYPVKCFSYLEKKLKKNKKKLLILVDNIDEFLAKIKSEEQHQLREILLTSSSFIIVGGSTKMFEQQYDYSKPFYEFFKIIRLEELSFDESVALLRVLGDEGQSKKIDEIVENTPQRIETLRRVTGGVPRTMVMLFDIFIEDNGNAFDDLMKILDEVTPLYKDRMDDLPPVLQEIVDTIALNWDGMSTKEIAKKTRMESKVVSAQMKQLEKYQIVESDALGKNKIYIIKERFFNIWYLMRYGRKKDRQRVEWLIQFLLSWYDRDELNNKAKIFMGRLQEEEIDAKYAYMMAESFGYVGIDDKIEHKLKRVTSEYLEKVDKELVKELSKSNHSIVTEAFQTSKKEGLEKAIKILEELRSPSIYITVALGNLYNKKNDYKKAEKYFMKAAKGGDRQALIRLESFYRQYNKYVELEKFYLSEAKNGNSLANMRLGSLYKQREQFDKAEKYYLTAINQGCTGALTKLGTLYKNKQLYDKAEKFYLEALIKNEKKAYTSLIKFYREHKQCKGFDEHTPEFQIKLNNYALVFLGHICNKEQLFKKAKEYYLVALNNNYHVAAAYLSLMYLEKETSLEQALYYAYKAYEIKKNAYTSFVLSIALLIGENYSKSYEFFLEMLNHGVASHKSNFIIEYITLLISKGQLYKAKEFFELPKYELKERYKPLWYALMTLMQEEFPVEIKKMGSELKETVEEVLVEVEKMKEKYGNIDKIGKEI